MPIDSSIYFQQQTPDFMGSIQKGLSMRDMLDDRKMKQDEIAKQKAISNAYAEGMSQDANGNPVFDSKKTMASLSGIQGAGKEAFDAQSQFQSQDAAQAKAKHEKLLQHYDDSGRLAGAALQNPAAYSDLRAQAIKAGLATEQEMPPVYDEAFLKSTLYRSMAGKEQVSASATSRGLDIQQQGADTNKKRLDIERGKLGVERVKAQTAAQKATGEAKAMTVSQAKQMGLYQSGLEAEKQYQAAVVAPDGKVKFDGTSNTKWIDKNDWAPNFMKSDSAKAAHSAQDRWIESFLRDASGAAIPPNERGAYAKDFFPVAGDSAQVVADKERARQLKMDAAKMAATGRAEAPAKSAFDSLPDDQLYKEYVAAGGE